MHLQTAVGTCTITILANASRCEGQHNPKASLADVAMTKLWLSCAILTIFTLANEQAEVMGD